MKKQNFWIFINSLLAFLSAYIFLKGIIIACRFIIIRLFGGATQLENFELYCSSPAYSKIWTQFSVISIYMIGFFISILVIALSYTLYKKFRMYPGITKLWFVWLYVLATTQSFGAFIRDIPFQRDIYHALNWMFIPFGIMLGIAVISTVALFFLNYMNIIRFLKMSPSNDLIDSPALMKSFYTRIALLPAFIGSTILTLINIRNINQFEIAEKTIIICCIGIAYIHFLKKDKTLNFRRVKNDTTGKINIQAIGLCIFAISAYFFISKLFY